MSNDRMEILNRVNAKLVKFFEELEVIGLEEFSIYTRQDNLWRDENLKLNSLIERLWPAYFRMNPCVTVYGSIREEESSPFAMTVRKTIKAEMAEEEDEPDFDEDEISISRILTISKLPFQAKVYETYRAMGSLIWEINQLELLLEDIDTKEMRDVCCNIIGYCNIFMSDNHSFTSAYLINQIVIALLGKDFRSSPDETSKFVLLHFSAVMGKFIPMQISKLIEIHRRLYLAKNEREFNQNRIALLFENKLKHYDDLYEKLLVAAKSLGCLKTAKKASAQADKANKADIEQGDKTNAQRWHSDRLSIYDYHLRDCGSHRQQPMFLPYS